MVFKLSNRSTNPKSPNEQDSRRKPQETSTFDVKEANAEGSRVGSFSNTVPTQKRQLHGLLRIYPGTNSLNPDLKSQGLSEGPYNVDVVAVHGLNGDAYETWTHKNRKFWLRDFLPKEIPGARIFSFGYNSAVMHSRSVSGIGDFARILVGRLMDERTTPEEQARPIVFVCHSMGGLVVKKALVIAHNEPIWYKNISDSTSGILFFATPHGGSTAGSLPKALACAANFTLYGTRSLTGKFRTDLLNDLEKDSNVLVELSQTFRNRTANLKIVSFYEQRWTKPLSTMIVETHSAVMGLVNEEQIPIDRDHREICRFDSEECGIYKSVYTRIKRIAGDAKKEVAGPSRNFEPDKDYKMDYNGLLGRIAKILDPVDFTFDNDYRSSNRCEGTCEWLLDKPEFIQWRDSDSSATTWLYGIPGCGKTYLMSKVLGHIEKHTDNSNSSAITLHFFCDKRVENISKRSLSSIIKTLSAQALLRIVARFPEEVEECLRQFEQCRDKKETLPWLFHETLRRVGSHFHRVYVVIDALDECDDVCDLLTVLKSEFKMKTLLHLFLSSRPHSTIGSIIDRGNKSHIYRIPVDSECVGPDIKVFIAERMKMLVIRDLGSERDAEARVVQGSDNLFLLAYFRLESLKKLQGIHTVRELEDALLALPASFKEYYDDALSKVKSLDSDKKMIARRIFVWTIFSKRRLKLEELAEVVCVNTGDDTGGFESGGRLLFSGLDEFCAGLLVAKRQDNQDDRAAILEPAHNTVKKYIFEFIWDTTPPLPSLRDHNACQTEIVETCLQYIRRIDWENTGKSYFLEYACNYWLLHLFDVINANGNLVRSLLQFVDSPDHSIKWWMSPFTKSLDQSVAETRYLESRYRSWVGNMITQFPELAEPKYANFIITLLEKQLEMHENRFGQNNLSTLKAMTNLAQMYFFRARYKDAERLALVAVATSKDVQRENHPDALAICCLLVSIYKEQSRFSEGKKLATQVIATSKTLFGDEHPETLNALSGLAGVMRDEGLVKESLSMREEILISRTQNLGEKHPDTAAAMSNVAVIYSDLGWWEKAENLKVKVLAIRKEILGEDHPETLAAMLNLSWSYKQRGYWEGAEDLFQKTLAARKRILGEKHPFTLTAMTFLAATYIDHKKWRDAEKLASEAVGALIEVLGESDALTLMAMASLGVAYSNLGRLSKAEDLLLRSVQARKLRGRDDKTATAMATLATIYHKQGRLTEAEDMISQAIEMHKSFLGPDHPYTLRSMTTLSSIYWTQGFYQKAISLLEQVAEQSIVILGQAHYLTLERKQRLSRWKNGEEDIEDRLVYALGLPNPLTRSLAL